MMQGRSEILIGNCLDRMRELDPDSIDSIVTDPPYGLEFMGKEWDHGIPAKDFWIEAMRVAKPGAHLLAFGGTRTYHRLACAIEDAGWEIRDCIMWVYGSGFPKSHDVSKAIDKAGGGTEAAKQWEGWGTALKPAWEPIIVARKPLCGTVAENVLKYEAGGMNIDECRVPTEDNLNGGAYATNGTVRNDGWRYQRGSASEYKQPTGRFPANLIHDGSDEVVRLFPQSGKSTGGGRKNGDKFGGGYAPAGDDEIGYGDSSSPARFFYCAKASKSDRDEGNIHPTVKPTDLMRYLCRLVTQPNGIVLDPFMGSGSTGKAAMLEGFRFVGIEMNPEYAEIAKHRIDHAASSMVNSEPKGLFE